MRVRKDDEGQGRPAMDEFIGERIEVEQSPTSPRPIRFKWRGATHEIVEILDRRVDVGFGDLPLRSRKWYTRRHRRYYTVKDSEGDVFQIYLDYANRDNRTWWMTRKVSGPQ